MMKIKVAANPNSKLLQKFNDSHDFDVIIKCKKAKFKLQMAFLYLESEYFDQMWQEGNKLIELHNLDEFALEAVLKVLYGGEIEITSVEGLYRIFEALNYLKIGILKEVICEELKKQITFLNSIELIEFLYQNNLLISQVEETLIKTDLEILRDPKHSIELNKLSNKVLNVILLNYQKKPQRTNPELMKECINQVLADYFHAHKRRAEEYFDQYNIGIIKEIWFQYHPQVQKPVLGTESEVLILYQRTIRNLTERIHDLKQVAEGKREKIRQLTQKNLEMKGRARVQEPPTPIKTSNKSVMYDSMISQMSPTQRPPIRPLVFNEPISLTSTYQSVNSSYNKKTFFPQITLSSLFSSNPHRKRSQ